MIAEPFPWRYSLLMLAALVAGSLLLRKSQSRLPLSWPQKFALGLGAFTGGVLGAKLPFALMGVEEMVRSAWLPHGKTILGGLAGAYLGVEAAKMLLSIRIKTGDSFAAPAAFGVGVGRLGCFLGGCCYGAPTTLPWGVTFPGVDAPRHPTQIYELAFHWLAAAGLFWLSRRVAPPVLSADERASTREESRLSKIFGGQLIKLYFLAYFAYRFGSEFLRPAPRLALGLTAYQWATIALAAVFAGLWLRDERQFSALRKTRSSPDGAAGVIKLEAEGSPS